MAKRIATLIAVFVLISCLDLTKAESKGESVRNYNLNEDNVYAQAVPYSRNKEHEQSTQYQPVNYNSKDDYSAHQSIYSSPPIPTYQQVSYIPEPGSQSNYQADAEDYKQPASYHNYSPQHAKQSDDQKKTVILAIPVKLALHVPETKAYGDRLKQSYNDGRQENFTPSTVYANQDERQENYQPTQAYNSNQAKNIEGPERPAYESNQPYSQVSYKPHSYMGNQIYDNQPPSFVEEPKNGPTYQIYNKRPEISGFEKEKNGLSIISGPPLSNVKDETSFIDIKSPIAYSQEVYQPNIAIVSKEKQYKDSTDNEPTYSNNPPKPTYYSSADAYESDQDDWQNGYLRGKSTEESGEEYPNGEATPYQADPDSYPHSFNKETSKKVARPTYDAEDDYDGGTTGVEPYANSNSADSLEGDSSFESGTGIQLGDIKENKNSNNFGNNDASLESFAISSEAGSTLGPFNSPSFPSASSYSFRNSFGIPSYQGASGLSLTDPALLFGNAFNGLPTDSNGNNINDATWANMATSSLQLPATNAAAYGNGLLDLSSLYGTLMRPLHYPMMASTTGQTSSDYNQAANYQPISLAANLLYGKPVNLKSNKLTFAAPSPLHIAALPLRVTKGTQQSGASKYRPSSILASLYSSSSSPVKSYLGTNGKSIFGSGIGGGFRLSSVFKPSTFISPFKYTSALDNLLSQIYKLL